MTREEAKQTIFTKSRSYESAHQNYIHLLSLHKIIDDIFDEHEAQIKAKDEEIEMLRAIVAKIISKDIVGGFKLGDLKARSIVAMLFWMMKRQKAIYIKSFNELGINNHNTSFYKGAYENSKMRFKQAYKILKDKA